MIISKGRKPNGILFKIGPSDIEIVDEYKYLGLYFTRSGSFIKAKKYISEQATKAMFSLLRKIKTHSLPFDLQIDLFDKTIKPILLYGCEIWGNEKVDVLERVQLRFYKYIFNLKKSTPSYMIYGELGITLLLVDINSRQISFWTKLVDNITGDQTTKLSSKLYQILLYYHDTQQYKSPRIDNIKTTLCHHGFSLQANGSTN